ncbi:MAG: hypothetical protein J6B12_03385 [Clostridia bacterium]|nr:hypothetical protein [Clostridia bacterium]
MADYPFKKGDFVVYGGNGVCKIEEVGELTFGSLTQCYYTLRPIADQSSLTYVPCDNEILTARLRFVLSKDKIEALLKDDLNNTVTWDNDRKTRLATFRDVLVSGDPSALLSMIRCIYLKRMEFEKINRKLSLSDSETLRSAIFSIESEFSFSLGIEKSEVAEYIRSRLEKTE